MGAKFGLQVSKENLETVIKKIVGLLSPNGTILQE